MFSYLGCRVITICNRKFTRTVIKPGISKFIFIPQLQLHVHLGLFPLILRLKDSLGCNSFKNSYCYGVICFSHASCFQLFLRSKALDILIVLGLTTSLNSQTQIKLPSVKPFHPPRKLSPSPGRFCSVYVCCLHETTAICNR